MILKKKFLMVFLFCNCLLVKGFASDGGDFEEKKNSIIRKTFFENLPKDTDLVLNERDKKKYWQKYCDQRIECNLEEEKLWSGEEENHSDNSFQELSNGSKLHKKKSLQLLENNHENVTLIKISDRIKALDEKYETIEAQLKTIQEQSSQKREMIFLSDAIDNQQKIEGQLKKMQEQNTNLQKSLCEVNEVSARTNKEIKQIQAKLDRFMANNNPDLVTIAKTVAFTSFIFGGFVIGGIVRWWCGSSN